jgi:hypothetical protein
MTCVNSRFYTPDGQFRALPFSPWTKAEEQLLILKEKMKMTGVNGLALYQVVGDQSESSSKILSLLTKLATYVNPKENLCDILGKWHQFNSNPGSSTKTTRFLLKKRLFINTQVPPSTGIEEDFLLFQVMEDILASKFPVGPEDALYLIALRAQLEYGDVHERKEVKYAI